MAARGAIGQWEPHTLLYRLSRKRLGTFFSSLSPVPCPLSPVPFTMSRSTAEHRRQSPPSVRCAVVTVSDTRKHGSDTGGDLIERLLAEAGHSVTARHIVPDEPAAIRGLVEQLVAGGAVDAVLVTGGTGIARRDQTFEAVSGLLSKTLPGYGELLRMLSYDQVGSAAMLSRAVGGVVGTVVVFTMPGSPAAVELAMTKLIVPELGHLVYEARK